MKVQINETNDVQQNKPNTQNGETVITDARGRSLKLKKLDIISESRLVRMLGQDTVTNQIYMNGYVLPAVMVREIDGESVPLPTSIREIEALIQRLDNDGIGSVLNYLQSSGADNPTSEEDELKN
jgi:hypothetical protein